MKSAYSPDDRSPRLETELRDQGTGSDLRNLHALLERPGFSIRARLITGLAILFVVTAGISIVTFVTLKNLEQKLRFLESTDSFTNEIQQARRFEKNYFLYGSDLSHVSEHISAAEMLLASSRNELLSVGGTNNVEVMERDLRGYRELVDELAQLGESDGQSAQNRALEIEEKLRSYGAEMVSVAFDMSEKERDTVNRMLKTARLVPVVLMLIFLLLAGYESFYLSRHLISRLSRLMEATRRIARGDFTQITPQRRFRDEFTNLVVAMNSMMSELQHRHNVLVHSHKLRAVGTLTAGIAHELNNPINNIMLTAEMLKEEYYQLGDDERLEMVSDLVDEAERSQKIVRNLLDFAREGQIEPAVISLSDILNDTVKLIGNQLKLDNVRLNLELPVDLPAVYGDGQLLSQVFLNLIMNSLDAMPDGGELDIAAYRGEDPDFVTVDVTDTGKGIPEHQIDSIFDPFFTTKPTGKGTGLGLSVSLGIVKKHGGTIKVDSKVNEGATLSVLLPVATIPVNSDGGNTGETEERPAPDSF